MMQQQQQQQQWLSSWRDGATKTAIEQFIAAVTDAGSPRFVPPHGRVAVFDNDGTLWCEKPIPIELGFIWQQLALAAAIDPSLAGRQPWQAALDNDHQWLAVAVSRHYDGDDTDIAQLMRGILHTFDGVSVHEYEAAAYAYVTGTKHPALGRALHDCAYQPMIELLRYLEAHDFACYIASGGDRDFMRPVTPGIYGIAPERIIGSSSQLRYTDDEHGGTLRYASMPDVFDDGLAKPVRIWSRIGQRPILATGNSNGDIPMLRFTGSNGTAMRLLINHDDPEREYAYTAGAEQALRHAATDGWTVVSIHDDWHTVFPDS